MKKRKCFRNCFNSLTSRQKGIKLEQNMIKEKLAMFLEKRLNPTKGEIALHSSADSILSKLWILSRGDFYCQKRENSSSQS